MAASTALHYRLVAGGFVHSIRRPQATAFAITDLMFQRSSYDVREALLVCRLRLTRFTDTACGIIKLPSSRSFFADRSILDLCYLICGRSMSGKNPFRR